MLAKKYRVVIYFPTHNETHESDDFALIREFANIAAWQGFSYDIYLND
jgi:hypothetical protein